MDKGKGERDVELDHLEGLSWDSEGIVLTVIPDVIYVSIF